MNGAEQRERHSRLTDLQTVVIGLAEQIVKDREAATTAIGHERTHRLKLADEQRAYVDGEDRKHEMAFAHFKRMTLWQRLRWIVRGV